MRLEHSLQSLSKWEEKWKKPYLATREKTVDEYVDYIRCMCLNADDFSDDIFSHLSSENYEQIDAYLSDPHTATTIKDSGGKHNNRIITAEVIYCWMTVHGIPFECDEWNLNKLITLITVCSEESKPSKKMPMRDILAQNKAINAARRSRR